MKITPKHTLPQEEAESSRSEDLAYLKIFEAADMESTHPNVLKHNGQKSIRATTTQGFLCKSPPISDYPNKPLEARFRIFIDNNTYDDAVIVIIDVIDLDQDKVLRKMALPRKSFPKAQAFTLLTLPFTAPQNTHISLRVYYFGYAYVILDKIALLDPETAVWDGTESPSEPGTGDEHDREAILGAYQVTNLPSQHTGVFHHRGGKAIRATTKEGFLSYGPYVTGYPTKPLDVYFCVYIDNNTADNREILHFDVYDAFQKKLLADRAVTRQQFPVAGQFTLFNLSFTPTTQSKLEFRIFYKGYAYIAANHIIVTDPDKIQLNSPADIPDNIFLPTRPTPRPRPSIPDPPGPQIEPQPGSQPIESATILHLPEMTHDLVTQQGGRNHGGSFNNGLYTPSNRGGIEFIREVDFDKMFEVEFEIEGNIANSHLDEMNGGKVSLLTILQQNGPYYLGLQRMRYEYRGGGILRVILTHNYGSEHGAGFIITVPEISGHYTTLNWGNEPHRFKLQIKGNRCRLLIDNNYTSPWTWSAGGVRGRHRVSFMIGNRIPPMAKQHPITRYRWVKISMP
ncbi:hypothetical protein CSB45_07865 [candidate division KSB3 bacterium]|uniref:Uncharacterized protein n=1 Tax=candidate division KSB3 bacterium TaxID=2044937 RepID=A0A2G6E5Q6_9BACT|nr:MAG: hypothetical protein CSB45_07865 [candidate division KSB3 bacterium]PIE29945.1 MAG: hypothetical protein CSA57_06565 [candidate division KSB3 bacterium]